MAMGRVWARGDREWARRGAREPRQGQIQDKKRQGHICCVSSALLFRQKRCLNRSRPRGLYPMRWGSISALRWGPLEIEATIFGMLSKLLTN